MKVIGVTGLNGSGKDEVLRYLNRNYAVPYTSTGDIVREIAAREGLEMNRENLDRVTQRYFQLYGQGYFLKLVIEKIKKQDRPVYGVSGVRSPEDVALLRSAFQPDFLLIQVVVSDDRVRFARMLARGSQRDNLTFAGFLEQDWASQEIFRIRATLAMADTAIYNDSKLENLHNEIEKLVKERRIFN